MLQIEFDVEIPELVAKVRKAVGELDKVKLLDDAEAFVLNRVRTRFLAEKGPDDAPWTPSRAGLKRREAGGSGTLYDTGRLFHSIQAALLGGKDVRVVATDVPYAKYLEPRWPFMGVTQDDADVLGLLLEKRVEKLLDDAVGG